MNNNALTELCALFELGTPIKPPVRVFGGLLHIMWRVDTDKGTYAIKQLSQYINLNDENVRKNYELTEYIAFRFSKSGIPAISAIEKSGQHLAFIQGIGFLVYPWVDAKTLDEDEISEKHAMKISEILAKMHKINLNVPEISQSKFDVHSKEKIIELISKSESFNCPFANHLKEIKDNILEANDAYQNAISSLKNLSVISHGDLDQKNVLWDENDNPILIDWESARKLNPTYEIVNASLDWSGITTHFNKDLFVKMIKGYEAVGGIINEEHLIPAFNGVLGNWLNWMVHNIERSCVDSDSNSESDQRNISIKEVKKVLTTLINLQIMIPKLAATLSKKVV